MAGKSDSRFVIAILVFVFEFSAAHYLQDPIQLTEEIKIGPYSRQNTLFGDVGIISGVRSCGGSGKIVHFRHEQCITGALPPCFLQSRSSGRSEMVFIPGESAQGVGVLSTVVTLADGLTKSYENRFDNVKLVAGQEYVAYGAGAPAPELIGKQYIFQAEIFRKSDRQILACAQGDFFAI